MPVGVRVTLYYCFYRWRRTLFHVIYISNVAVELFDIVVRASRVRSKQTFLPGCRLWDVSERTKDTPKNESFYIDLQHWRYKPNTHIYVQVLAREHTRLPFKPPTLRIRRLPHDWRIQKKIDCPTTTTKEATPQKLYPWPGPPTKQEKPPHGYY